MKGGQQTVPVTPVNLREGTTGHGPAADLIRSGRGPAPQPATSLEQDEQQDDGNQLGAETKDQEVAKSDL